MYILPMILGRTYDMAQESVGVDIFPREQLDRYEFHIVLQEIKNYITDSKYRMVTNTDEARDFLEVQGDLALRIKAGMIDLQGVGSYLKEAASRSNTVEILVKVHYETVSPVSGIFVNTVRPVSRKKTVRPVSRKKTVRPVSRKKTVRPVSRKKTVRPVSRKKTVRPVSRKKTVRPVSRKKTVRPVSRKKTVSSVSGKKTVSPVSGKKTTVSSVSGKKTVSPVSEKKTVSPVSGKKTVSPVSGKKTVSPVSGKKTVSSVSGKKTVSPVSGKKTVSSVSGKKTVSPVSGKKTVSSVSGKKTVSPVSGKKTVNSVSGKKTVSPVSGKKTVNSVSGKRTVSPVSGKKMVSSVSGKKTVSPVSGKKTVTRTLPSNAQPLPNWRTIDRSHISTHYARSITYGGDLIAALRFKASNSNDREFIKAKATATLQSQGNFGIDMKGDLEILKESLKNVSSMEISYFATVPIKVVPNSIESLIDLVQDFPKQTQQVNNGIGVPLRMELFPLSSLGNDISPFILQTSMNDLCAHLEEDFDDIRAAKRALADWMEKVPPYIPAKFNEEIGDFNTRLEHLTMVFYRTISNLDMSVHNPKQFQEALEEYHGDTGDMPDKYFREFLKLRDRVVSNPGILSIVY
ncbi:hypothetical protein LAZ67_3000194 [Cordylochernes scorpioides]|uniref:Uncharacterized protein n=1 Tax=Cordylochernes scorpioides TaxID=51811 RepID=A0ABY6K7L6_9ARAC|nr:hypothetical protein LAZ67_3000194 [Cordylochernes scorpioides]